MEWLAKRKWRSFFLALALLVVLRLVFVLSNADYIQTELLRARLFLVVMLISGILSAAVIVAFFFFYQREVTRRLRIEHLLKSTVSVQKAILGSASYTILSTSLDGLIRTFNPAAERMFGYQADE